jgi:hypothetical protein
MDYGASGTKEGRMKLSSAWASMLSIQRETSANLNEISLRLGAMMMKAIEADGGRKVKNIRDDGISRISDLEKLLGH